MHAWEVRATELMLREVEPPRSDDHTQVIRVTHMGICGSDLAKLRHPSAFKLPDIWRPGHEIVGLDDNGRSVALDALVTCGSCDRCTVGETHLCLGLRRVGWDLPGGFAEKVSIPRSNVYSVQDDLDPLLAVLADPAAVAIHSIRCNPVGPPGRLAIIGAGPLGLLTAFYAHQQGWAPTVVHRAGRAPSKALLRNVPAQFLSAQLLDHLDQFDLVIDSASGGTAAPLEMALRIVRDGGTIIVQNAYHPGVQMLTSLRDLFRRSVRLVGTFSYCRRGGHDYTLALGLLSNYSTQVGHLISIRGRLSDLPTCVPVSGEARSRRQVLTLQI